MGYKIAVLSGDGIGPEVMKQALKVLKKIDEKYGLSLEYNFADCGGIAIDNYGTALPDETIKVCETASAILFGSIGGPKWEKLPPSRQPERAALLPLRKHFNLYTNLRQARIYEALADNSSLKAEFIAGGLDIMMVRELTGGIYFGAPKEIEGDKGARIGIDTLVYSEKEIERIARMAFNIAGKRKKKLTSIDKANVLSSMVLWREVVTSVGKEYPDIELNSMYVDNAAMQIVRNPRQFDVILAGNLFGDILSDELAMITGSIGMLPSASLSDGSFGLYEPIGGSAPDIAGRNIANPIAQIMSAAMMLKYSFNLENAYTDIETAVNETLNEGLRTKDIVNPSKHETVLSTDEMGDEIVRRI